MHGLTHDEPVASSELAPTQRRDAMIKPSDVDPSAVILNPAHLVIIEQQFDTAIKLAHASGRWPARVPNERDGVSPAEIEHVADRYRAEGWKILSGQSPNVTGRAIIDHPNRRRGLGVMTAPDTAMIAQPHPAPDGGTMEVGTGGAKGMPSELAEAVTEPATEE